MSQLVTTQEIRGSYLRLRPAFNLRNIAAIAEIRQFFRDCSASLALAAQPEAAPQERSTTQSEPKADESTFEQT